MTRAHDMLPDTAHDEQALQDFARDFRRFLKSVVMPGNANVFEKQVEPAFRAEHERGFENFREIREAMIGNAYYQFWSAMQRCSQELMWESVIAPTERQQVRLIEQFRELANTTPAGGTLTLNPDFEIPRYHTAVDIHLQPGGYHSEFTDDDVSAGAIYEGGLPIYIDGELGAECDGIGRALVHYLQTRFPDYKPGRILDMGCAVGNSTLPWARSFPDAQVHAIDVAAPCLRFAHARAEQAGVAVHFSQQNAERTNFEAESFDVVASHIMLHETSKPALRNVVRETHRLLRPGGLMLHLDVPRGDSEFQKFMSQWETYNNNEVFSAYMTDLDQVSIAEACGFEPGRVFMAGAEPAEGGVRHAYNPGGFAWPVLVGRK